MGDRPRSCGLGAAWVLAVALTGCSGMSDYQRQHVGAAITFAALAGIVEVSESAVVRKRAREDAATAWACSPSQVHARIERKGRNGDSHLVGVRGCGRDALFRCRGRSCWEQAFSAPLR